MMGEILTLNLLFNYPVKWGEYEVLRDFVQNFYDAKPCDKWRGDFGYEYDSDNRRLTMTMDNSGFSYDWILHIGASNKTDSTNAAGYFGEGFKIAALCAIRDLKWDVTMMSRDWKAHVIGQQILLDGTKQVELAYEMDEAVDENRSRLVIEGVSQGQFSVFEAVLLSFYYPENRLLGKRIYEDANMAVYTRSDMEIPSQLPETYEFGREGAVFVRYQMRGTLPFPCVLALHTYRQDDRERKHLYVNEVIRIMYNVAEGVDSSAAAYLLEQIPDKWAAYPKVSVDTTSWYYVVCQLIRTLWRSDEETSRFMERHPNLLYTQRFIKGDIRAENRRRQAKAWMRHQPVRYKLVMERFMLLGYPELEEQCEKAGGFSDSSAPTEREAEYLSLLEDLRENLFDGFFPENGDIECRVIRSENAAWCGKAETKKIGGAKQWNKVGLQVRAQLMTIAIKEEYFDGDCFPKALSTYLHEMSHMFGGDNTQNFSRALTYVAEILIAKSDTVSQYQKRWEAV